MYAGFERSFMHPSSEARCGIYNFKQGTKLTRTLKSTAIRTRAIESNKKRPRNHKH